MSWEDRRMSPVESSPHLAHIDVGQARATLVRPFHRPEGRALTIGLTGGIGSGKTTAAKALKNMGATIADSDAIAREIVAPDSEGLRLIVERFGTDILTDEGTLDRGALAQGVFTNTGARADLEAITHPLIAHRAAQILAHAPIGGLGVNDVPLLVETGMAPMFDLVIVVETPLDQRLCRLEDRGMSKADAKARIAAQARDEQRRKVATILVENTGTADDLTEVMRQIDRQWLRPQAANSSLSKP